MHTQTPLAGHECVTASLVVPFICDLRASLDEAIEDLRESPASNDADVNEARSEVMPCIVALQEEFTNRWVEGSDILTDTDFTEGQPRGFKPVQVLARACRPAYEDPVRG